ncbi:MAG: methyltransferase [Achromobacter pulmonis]
MDRFYTSPELADTLVSLARKRRRAITVADFACGEGSLLFAAERRWPLASMIANDISAHAIASIRRNRPQWKSSCADFLNPRSVRSSALRHHVGSVDLVLLNPPFSRRNRRTYKIIFGDEELQASIALAFILNSLPFLRPSGAILAVVPDGCLVGACDEPVWRVLRSHYEVEVIRDNARSAFHGVRARTCLVRMTKLEKQIALVPSAADKADLRILRGRVQMHCRKIVSTRLGQPLVHTSHLLDGVVADSGEYVEGRVVAGPALLFPRVGRITPGKLCVLGADRRVVLSDCVLAVTSESVAEAKALRRQVLEEWPAFASAYRGTGAPYITLERASAVLSMIAGAGRSAPRESQIELLA